MQTASAPLERIISRLERVHRSGRGYTARCPAHEDRTASLSVGEGHDGRVLLNCFAGCGAAAVVDALGMQVADLFERRERADMTPAERSQMREHAQQARWRAALNVLDDEATILLLGAQQLAQCHRLNAEDHNRIITAAQRIADARQVLNGGR